MIDSFENFWDAPGVLLDVRSPGEYAHGHLPGAFNLALFTNEERALVGTAYKQNGKEKAIGLGLSFVGPKLSSLVAVAKSHAKDGDAKVYCWRGGMRSSSMAWLLQTAGLRTCVLEGGYKNYRRWVKKTLEQSRCLRVLGGLTGSGKTTLLHALERHGEQILDLEALARHKGSSFGMLGMPLQPTNEHFENLLSTALSKTDSTRVLWVEDESRMIGGCRVPDSLYTQMQLSECILIECPIQERLDRLLVEYGQHPRQDLLSPTERLKNRLGGARTKEALSLINAGQLQAAICLVLDYYDKAYRYELQRRRGPLKTHYAEGLSADQWAAHLLKLPSPAIKR